jgi:2-polyprenyl-6-hydroxyphenyl methylase/3-demethylubiquinone-9 3-methyltransferase
VRFEFGANWARFLETLNEDRLAAAESSLRTMLDTADLRGKRFLDVGSGSGLFSLVARRMGAKVHSFDYDAESVACTSELKRRYFSADPHWQVESGSILDNAYLSHLGQFDVVYSWGVLHHTGAMWQAIENVVPLVARGGKLFVAIYNDQGALSAYWRRVKELYNSSLIGRCAVLTIHAPYLFGLRWLVRKISGRAIGRGMALWTDTVDWLGGLPFEVAAPEAVFDFFRERGFALEQLRTCGGHHGCNEFVFSRRSN